MSVCCGKNKGVIGKWTTPSIMYKPTKVEMADVAEIYVKVSQRGTQIAQYGIDTAQRTEEGFIWLMSQEDTAKLQVTMTATVQVDYKTTGGLRYTTMPKTLEVVNSAVEEEI